MNPQQLDMLNTLQAFGLLWVFAPVLIGALVYWFVHR